ncbi:MAG: glycoside hydrolase family protein, partial [Acetobacteraceae bacterium]
LYYHTGALGTTRAITTSNGANFDSCGQNANHPNGSFLTYAPFGAEIGGCTQSASPYKFTGKYRDAESTLDYFGARYYQSNLGRFLSPDFSNDPEPVPYANLANPQSLNLYAYVLNNPLAAGDPTGHSAFAGGYSDSGCEIDGADNGCGAPTPSGGGAVESPGLGIPPVPSEQINSLVLSEEGREFIEEQEGFSAVAYKDVAGNLTIGYGHLIHDGDNFSHGITRAQADKLLEKDVVGAERAVNRGVTRRVNQHQFDALVDFTFNEGAHAFVLSSLLRDLNAGRLNAMRADFSMYDVAGGRVIDDLVRRRRDEYIIFSQSRYPGVKH